MNKIKRILSYLSVIAVCIASNIGLPVKASPVNNTKASINKTDDMLYLYDGKILKTDSASSNDNIKIADHYSHESHRSHYSSHY